MKFVRNLQIIDWGLVIEMKDHWVSTKEYEKVCISCLELINVVESPASRDLKYRIHCDMPQTQECQKLKEFH